MTKKLMINLKQVSTSLSSSVLDDMNIKRLLNSLKKSISSMLMPESIEFTLQGADLALTQHEVKEIIDEYLQATMPVSIGYEVICDARNNPAQAIGRSELHLDVYIRAPHRSSTMQLNPADKLEKVKPVIIAVPLKRTLNQKDPQWNLPQHSTKPSNSSN